MALKSTIFKAQLSVSDLDRGYYAEHALTLARHPSENDQRMMVRLLAFALYAGPMLEFGRGLSSDEEPALWQKSYGGEIERWIAVGLPDERSLRSRSPTACSAPGVPVTGGPGDAPEELPPSEQPAIAITTNREEDRNVCVWVAISRFISEPLTVRVKQDGIGIEAIGGTALPRAWDRIGCRMRPGEF